MPKLKARVFTTAKDIKREARRQLIEAREAFVYELEALFLYVLHVSPDTQFGKERLKRIYKLFSDEFYRMCEKYEMDDTFPMRQKLKNIGVDLEEWHKEYTRGIK